MLMFKHSSEYLAITTFSFLNKKNEHNGRKKNVVLFILKQIVKIEREKSIKTTLKERESEWTSVHTFRKNWEIRELYEKVWQQNVFRTKSGHVFY